MIKNLESIFSHNLSLLCDNYIRVKFKYVALVFLFVGLSATFLISMSCATLVYSHTNSTHNMSNADLTNQSINLSFKTINPKVKEFVLNDVVNKSKAAIIVGFIDPNGTKVYNFGNISKANNIPVNGSTLFNIASITKPFTTLVLADMVKQGIVHLDDPIEKYLPSMERFLNIMEPK